MRGSARGGSVRRSVAPAPVAPRPSAAKGKKRVLFVCIGNSCRSPMAEAFARAYGSDVLEARSAGLAPASIVQELTKQVLKERNVPAEDLFPKGLELMLGEPFDVVVNLSGLQLPQLWKTQPPRVVTWPVPDPIGKDEAVYREVAARIEALVMGLILELRPA